MLRAAVVSLVLLILDNSFAQAAPPFNKPISLRCSGTNAVTSAAGRASYGDTTWVWMDDIEGYSTNIGSKRIDLWYDAEAVSGYQAWITLEHGTSPETCYSVVAGWDPDTQGWLGCEFMADATLYRWRVISVDYGWTTDPFRASQALFTGFAIGFFVWGMVEALRFIVGGSLHEARHMLDA